MASRPLRDEILSLPSEARLRLLEEVWDSLANSQHVTVPKWHRDVLSQRVLENATEPWADLKQRL